MSEQWPLKPLGEICEVLDKLRKPITKKNRVSGEYPYYGATGIVDYVDGYIFDEKLVLIGEDGAKWGSGENTAFSVEGKYWVNNHAHVIRPNRNIVLDNWLIYFLNMSDLSEHITGLTVPKLNQGKLRAIQIPIPPLDEQQRIVSTLDEAMKNLSLSKLHVEQRKNDAVEIFESVLDRCISNTEGENSITTRNFPDVVFIQEGPGIRKYEYEENGYPMINVRCVQDGYIDMSSARAANIELANGKWKHFQVCEGDILYTISGTIGRTAIVNSDNLPLLMNTSVVRFRPLTDELDRNYLYYFVRSKFFLNQLTNFVSGTAIKNVGPTHIKKLEISYPPIKEQKKISQKLDLLKIETNLLDDSYRLELDAIEELKKSILQDAFSEKLTRGISA